MENFIFTAFGDWWQQHERGGWNWVNLRALVGQDAFSVRAGTEMSLLAGAARDADTRAQWVGFLASAVAAFALTVFFVFAAGLADQRHGFGDRNATGYRWYADALFVFQESGFAEASDDALFSAHRAWMGIGAGRGAGGAARHEKFVFFALRQFRWVGEEHGGLGGFALKGWDAQTVRVSQMSLFAKASDDAVLGADRAWVGIGAGRGASRSARLEFFIGWACWDRFG
jgi:hypothetical protein